MGIDYTLLSKKTLNELQEKNFDGKNFIGLSDQALQELDNAHNVAKLKAAPQDRDISKTESAVRGLVNVGTGTLADEIGGFSKNPLGAGKEILNKFGANFNDKDVQEYRKARDEYRIEDDSAYKQNPWSYRTGYAAGVAPTLFAGAAAQGGNALLNTAKAGAAQGAIGGIGGGTDYREKNETLGDMALNATIGGSAGFVAPYAMHGAVETVKAVPKIFNGVKNIAKTLPELRGNIGEAAQYARGQTANDPGFLKPLTYAKEFISGLSKTANREIESATTLKTLADESRKILGPNHVNLSDEEAILEAFSQPGMNPVKQHISEKAASIPGRYNPEDLNAAMKLGPEEIGDALNFSKRAEAQELAPEIAGIQKTINQGRGKAYGKYKEAAAGEFDKNEAHGVLQDLQEHLDDTANSSAIGGPVKHAIADAMNAIQSGKALKQYGLVDKSNLGEIAGDEALKRLHAGRRIVDDVLQGLEPKSPEYGVLKGVRNTIDKRIKTTPSMELADTIFSQGADFDKTIFGPFMRKVGKGKYELDSAKLAKAFGDNDTAQRLKEAIPDFRKYIQANDDVFANVPGQLKALDQLENLMGTARNARILEKARANPSGTAASVNRALRGNKTNFLEELYQSPVDVRQGVANFQNTHAKMFGKALKDLSPAERSAMHRMYLWSRQNPTATLEETQKAFQSMMPSL